MAPLVPPHTRPHGAGDTNSTNANNTRSKGAQSLQVITLSIPNPEWQGIGSSGDAQRINASISFNYLTSFDIRTLSTVGASNGNDVTGLLYVPDLDEGDPCTNSSAQYLPQNVTRQANLPNQDYQQIAIAPWTSGDCALSYMKAGRARLIQGILFFIPGNTSATPPDESDPVWDVNETRWKQENGFPVYAIPGQNAQILLEASAAYSGNMTDVPFGHQLTEYYDSRDYVRLYVDIDTGSSGSTLPSLWVFLLVVLGILLAIIGLTSLSMHLLQRRRRQNLRRRVASGEVDLEALGIKRLTVPQELLDTMPLYTYGTGAPVTQQSQKSASVQEEKLDGTKSTTLPASPPAATLLRSSSYRPSPLSQPTCAICLDDFVAASPGTEGTTVRELPCHHLFHPECCDTFLRDSSSLCPMCKRTVLPKGYCPKTITNAMVRRERMVRQVRERVSDDPDAAREVDENGLPLSRAARIRVRTFSGFSQLRPGRRISEQVSSGQQMQQLSSTAPIPPVPTTADSTAPLTQSNSISQAPLSTGPPPQVQPPATASRREWARQRAVDMLGERAPADPDAEETRTTSTWRKAVRGMFPGFRR
ncbi:hypothetical protein PRZ48_004842 [Zasmidium cellare]|uniref:RING-type domain-containing protein n=1 Tax=Zasmidium cellare TaxID=395010 RepID=A0ABR0EQN9_ZASCE|nr:hypothetical protein PRZ48_004842 [Zasmidium cellare]